MDARSRAYALPSQLSDAYDIAPRLREADKAEIFASTGDAPIQALVEGIQRSDQALTIIGHQDTPIGIFGVCHRHELPGIGLVWMLATNELPTIVRELVRQTPLWLNAFHASYPVLGNVVDARNELHIKWIKRVGFTFINRHLNFGHEGREFLEFVKVSDKCATP